MKCLTIDRLGRFYVIFRHKTNIFVSPAKFWLCDNFFRFSCKEMSRVTNIFDLFREMLVVSQIFLHSLAKLSRMTWVEYAYIIFFQLLPTFTQNSLQFIKQLKISQSYIFLKVWMANKPRIIHNQINMHVKIRGLHSYA